MAGTFSEGTEFASYRITRTLGSGGFATVYLAEDTRPAMRRKVAIKVLHDRLAIDESFRERFFRESQAAGNLDHPNVIPIYDAGEADGRFYIAMRYVEGSDLRARLESGPISPADAVAVVRQISSALDLAHRHGLVHRDVKPGNVLLPNGDTAHVYLADFGLTKEATAEQTGLTAAGQFLGTLNCASPEQIEGRELDGRSDQYAVGCLLYECLTGHPPFGGTLQKVIACHLTEAPPRVTDAMPGLPRALDAVVAKAMAKDPDDRYASCTELADAALAALDAIEDASAETIITGALAPPPPVSPPTGSPTVPPPTPPTGFPTTPPPGAPPPPAAGKGVPIGALVGAGVAVLLLLIAVVVVAANRNGGESPPSTEFAADDSVDVSTTVTTASGEFVPPDSGEEPGPSGPTGPSAAIVPTRVAAPLQSADGIDACSTPQTYDAENMLDGNSDTAWRTTGDGTGRRITLNLGAETRVTSVGLINGMAKVDPCDGTDRYFDQRRITSVEWVFEDGQTVTQDLDPNDRAPQTIPVDAVTTRLQIEIRSTTAPGDRDFTPISDVFIEGAQ